MLASSVTPIAGRIRSAPSTRQTFEIELAGFVIPNSVCEVRRRDKALFKYFEPACPGRPRTSRARDGSGKSAAVPAGRQSPSVAGTPFRAVAAGSG